MPRRRPHLRKRRTREYIIADLGVNYVERHVLLSGFSAEQPIHDYGIDLLVFTYTDLGEPESGEVRVQVKATDHLQTIQQGEFVAIRLERADVRTWILEPMPVILIVYDAPHDRAFWLYVQNYFAGTRRFTTSGRSTTLAVRIPSEQVLSLEAMRRFQGFRNAVAAQIEGVRHEQR